MSRILVVDDERENRVALQRALTDENPSWDCFLASDDKEGVEILRHQIDIGEPIDILLTDLVMSTEQSGMCILREARNIDPMIMTILFTAKEKSLDRYEAFDYGAFDVVEKNIRGGSAIREIIIKTRAALQYREWSKKINFMRRYFDPALFNTIERDPSILEMRQKVLTICFWDIRGFSRLCEILKAHPTLIAGFLRDYFNVASKCIFQHNGILDKFIGDGVMGLFGVIGDDSDKTAAINAVKSAIDLRDKFDSIIDKWMNDWVLYTPVKIDISIGCGIHTGDVLIGNVGTDMRDQFTALGPDVNVASRIENRAKARQILLSQATESRVRSVILSKKALTVNDIKNIPGDFDLFEVD
jgi:class 3 adenylate cyclase/FixJ family two-component response regulator